MSLVLFYNEKKSQNKEKPRNNRVCPNIWLVHFSCHYFLFLFSAVYISYTYYIRVSQKVRNALENHSIHSKLVDINYPYIRYMIRPNKNDNSNCPLQDIMTDQSLIG